MVHVHTAEMPQTAGCIGWMETTDLAVPVAAGRMMAPRSTRAWHIRFASPIPLAPPTMPIVHHMTPWAGAMAAAWLLRARNLHSNLESSSCSSSQLGCFLKLAWAKVALVGMSCRRDGPEYPGTRRSAGRACTIVGSCYLPKRWYTCLAAHRHSPPSNPTRHCLNTPGHAKMVRPLGPNHPKTILDAN